MFKHESESPDDSRPELAPLIERLSADARNWAEAELALARAELGDLRGQAIRAAAFAVLAAAFACAAMSALSEALIAWLAPQVESTVLAALIVALILLVLVGWAVVLMRRSLSWKVESILFRWFGGGAAGRGQS